MEFREVRGTRVRFSVWETRLMDWESYITATGRPWDHYPAFSQTPTHPVVNITLADAVLFCEWLTQTERKSRVISGTQIYRLPTNREWDAASGLGSAPEATRAPAAGDLDRYPWGREWPPGRGAGNYNTSRIEGADDDGFQFTAPVGKFNPSVDGLYDLGGNAWEWTGDAESGAISAATLRGGSWMHWRREFLAASFRLVVKEDTRSPGIGFRCVLGDSADLRKTDEPDPADGQARRMRLLEKPAVPGDELRSALAQRRMATPDVASARPAGAAMAVEGAAFENSLNMKLLPLPGRHVLLGEHEVRVADYRRFILDGSNPPAVEAGFRKTPDHPVTGISWTEAEAFCAWLTGRERSLGIIAPNARYRLPSGAEWRAAATAGNASSEPALFAWGSAWPPPPGVANINGTGIKPVKSHPPGLTGFYDLAGNAAEWTQDAEDENRLLCGGSWISRSREELLISSAQRMPPDTRSPEIGFRILLEFPAQDENRR